MFQVLDAKINSAGVASSDHKKLMALVQDKHEEDDSHHMSAPAATADKSSSTSIVDIIQDMKEKSEAGLADARQGETSAAHNVAMLKQSLEDQVAADTGDLNNAKTTLSTAKETKAREVSQSADCREAVPRKLSRDVDVREAVPREITRARTLRGCPSWSRSTLGLSRADPHEGNQGAFCREAVPRRETLISARRSLVESLEALTVARLLLAKPLKELTDARLSRQHFSRR